MRKALALLFLSVLAAAPARADVVMDYDCYTSVSGSMLPSMNNRGVVAANKPLPRLPSASVDFSYRLRVVVEGGVLGLQLVVDDAVMKEIGFDFDEGSYYEIDPSEGRHEKAALKDLEVDYLKQKAEIVRAGLAAPFSQPAGAETGRMKDYDLDIKRAILGGYILGLPCAAYRFEQKDASLTQRQTMYADRHFSGKAWVTDRIDGADEFKAAVAKFRDRAPFYKMEQNEFSDFLALLFYEDMPVVRLKYANSSLVGMSRSYLTLRQYKAGGKYETGLLYPGSKGNFRASLRFKGGENYRGEVSRLASLGAKNAHQVFFDYEERAESFYGYIATALFLLGLFALLQDRGELETALVWGWFDFMPFFLLGTILFALVLAHSTLRIPYFDSMFFELTLVIALFAGFYLFRWALGGFGAVLDLVTGKVRPCGKCGHLVRRVLRECPKCGHGSD